MRPNKKSNSLQKISLPKEKKKIKNKKAENPFIKNKENNNSLGKINIKKEKQKATFSNALFNLIRTNNIQKFEEIIKENKSLINKLNNNGLSLLHILVIKNNIKLIELLLNNGADVNIKSLKKKRTPLHFAYIYQKNESNELINLLLKYGAKEDILDNDNKKPMEYKKNLNKIKENNDRDNKVKKIKITKERKKDGYKGNIYKLKDSKDSSFVIITMDNISYLTSDENTINQISDLTTTKNNSINITNNVLRDSLDENNTKSKNIKNLLIDSLEIKNNIKEIQEENIEKLPKNKNNTVLIKDINKINSFENLDSFYTTLLTNKRNSYINSSKIRATLKTEDKNTISSHYDYTENSTFKILNNENNNNTDNNTDNNEEKKTSKKISSHISAMSTLSQTNQKYNKIIENENNINYKEINNNCSYLLKWLIEIGLSDYYENFLNNKIYDINKLIEQMKSSENKFGYEDIENILGIHTPGHIFRILIKLEIDANIIDKTISNFMIGEKIINDLIYSSNYDCGNWCNSNKVNINLCGIKNINIDLKENKKNDLESFLSRYNLNHLYQNFFHNGFDQINYVILQMYSSYFINYDILENYFHIYDEKQRHLTMQAIQNEVIKVNNFINSENYLKNPNKEKIKYENIDFTDEEKNDKEGFYIF